MSAKVNLAPESYQSSQRQKERKKLATTLGVTVCLVAVGLVVTGVLIVGFQKIRLSMLQKDITNRQAQVASHEELDEAVTAQQHLASIVSLHRNQAEFSRFFTAFQSVAPQGLAASSVSVGADNTIELSGSARNIDLVTKFAKALSAGSEDGATTNASSPSKKSPFSNVKLAAVTNDNQGGVSFKLTTSMSTEVTNGNK